MVMAARNEGVGGKLTVVDSGMRVGAARPLVDKERMNAGGLGEAMWMVTWTHVRYT